ncbi:MAG: DUF7695 domain-containing protein [Candidatus Kariarchaeaceae archaeon]|jgi:hypothetical protein
MNNEPDKKKRKIIVNKIQCNVCQQTIESTYRHDFKWCQCNSCAVDGGHSYLKRIGGPMTELSEFEYV